MRIDLLMRGYTRDEKQSMDLRKNQNQKLMLEVDQKDALLQANNAN